MKKYYGSPTLSVNIFAVQDVLVFGSNVVDVNEFYFGEEE